MVGSRSSTKPVTPSLTPLQHSHAVVILHEFAFQRNVNFQSPVILSLLIFLSNTINITVVR